MTNFASRLESLGLEQYLDAFIGEGFESWETLCDVQESDLEALGVKLGHRRKLQRAIAEYRGISYDRLFGGSPAAQEGPSDASRAESSQSTVTGKEATSGPPTETKRKYRRHPKADENAPEKPPSAYVLFSNKVREEVKGDNMSFTGIAQLVGARWQKLDPSEKEPFESQAAALKEQYNIKLSAYKKTDAYREYAQYLSDFKLKHGPQPETKRPKLDPQSSGGSISAASTEVADTHPTMTGHGRLGSISSVSGTSHVSTLASPTSTSLIPVPSLPHLTATGPRAFPSLPRPTSPQAPPYRQRQFPIQLSNHSSTSEDSGQVSYDALSRTATLSLSTPPTGTPPLPPHALGSARSDQGGPGEAFPWASRIGQTAHQTGSVTPSGPAPMAAGITLPSPTIPNEAWRDRGMEWTRHMQTSPTTSIGGQAPGPPLPPLLGPDRLSDLTHNQVQRTLPPLRQNPPPGPSLTSYQSTGSSTQLSQHGSAEPERRYSQSLETSGRDLEHNENEAASTLAGLATRPGGSDTPISRSHARRRP